jgi:hypothetical protein
VETNVVDKRFLEGVSLPEELNIRAHRSRSVAPTVA